MEGEEGAERLINIENYHHHQENKSRYSQERENYVILLIFFLYFFFALIGVLEAVFEEQVGRTIKDSFYVENCEEIWKIELRLLIKRTFRKLSRVETFLN